MSTTSMKTKTGRVIQLPSKAEEARIKKGITLDKAAASLSDAQWARAKPHVRMGRPPKTEPLKVPTTIRFDADVLLALKATGKGWQTRVNNTMRNWVRRNHLA